MSSENEMRKHNLKGIMGKADVISKDNVVTETVAKWCINAGKRISATYPDFIVGKPGAYKETLEDDGRTLDGVY